MAGERKSSSFAVYHSPIGPIRIAASKRGVLSLKMLFGKHGSSSATETCSSDIDAPDEETKAHLKECFTWLDNYFEHSVNYTVATMPALDFGEKGWFVVHVIYSYNVIHVFCRFLRGFHKHKRLHSHFASLRR